MQYKFKFKPYQLRFKQPLQTSHGIWGIREGIIIRLTDELRQVGYGEIAPLPWFGSETIEEAVDFCQQLIDEITTEKIFSIPDSLPACQFGFASAWENLNNNSQSPTPTSEFPIPHSILLPTGKAALEAWQALSNQSNNTFKWKIGVSSLEDELKIFQQLAQALPAKTKLRLDANGGLSYEEAKQWLQECDCAQRSAKGDRAEVEFLEQPLAVNQFDAMLDLSKQHSTSIALDESVATIKQMQAAYDKGWRGIFVIKPAIAGYPSRLRQFCQTHAIDAVFSTVFETAIGKQAALNIAAELSHRDRAIGFGVNYWFNENEETWLECLWNNH